MLELIRIPYAGGYIDITWALIGAILVAGALVYHWRSEKKERQEMDGKLSR